MPTRRSAHRAVFAGLKPRARRRAIAATLSTGLLVPVATIVLLTIAGCRSDQASRSGLSALRPSQWFARNPVADEVDLKPIPQDGNYPPVPPPIGRAFVPSPAPEPDSFYGVRPTGAEAAEGAESAEGTAGPTWTERLRRFFRRDEPTGLRPVTQHPASSPSASPTASRRPAIALGPPTFEPQAVASRQVAVNIAAPIEPTPEPFAERRPSRLLPLIVPRRPSGGRSEPAPWPYPTPDRRIAAAAHRDAGPARLFAEPATFRTLSVADQLAEAPALLP